MEILGPLLIAFFTALAVTPVVRKFAIKFKAVDCPNARKVHHNIMPRLGGLAICLAFWVTVLLTQEITREIGGLLVGGAIICLVGVWDDFKNVSPKTKLLAQIIAACVVVAAGIRVDFLTNPLEGLIGMEFFQHPTIGLWIFSYPLTVLWIIGITNAVNLIDGLDGLAAGVSSIAALTLGVVSLLEGQGNASVLFFILAASALGFLFYNFYPASIFMGDTGSLFLGFNLSTLAIIGLTKSTTIISLFLPIIILGIPIFDTLFAIFRRFVNGKPIFSPDKEHLHHRLLALGLTHRLTVLTIYGISLLLGASAVIMSLVTTAQGMLLMVAVTLGVFIAADKVGILQAKGRKENPQDKKVYHHAK